MTNLKLSSNGINKQSILDLFDDSLAVYHKLVGNNYMNHREIYAILKKFFLDFNSPLSLLDLGCGDAKFLANSLPNQTEINYLGIDLSQLSLEQAKDNLANLQGKKTFIEGDFTEILTPLTNSQSNSFNLVFSSFAIHNLDFEAKKLLFNNIYNLLNSEGIFIIVDIFCQEGENKNDYFQRYFEEVDRNWSELNDREKSLVKEHMFLNDLPENKTTIEKLARESGFVDSLQLYQDPLIFFQSLCFYKSR